jgi:ABC-2 type transport system ATP-binding protein
LSLQVRPGRCYGFFGRNGAGKTTTIKCLLDLLRPTAGAVRVFGLDPHKNEVAVKSRFTYVPDSVAFYPWMTVRDTLDYLGSFRPHWNDAVETDLLRRFELDPGQTRRPSGFLCFCPWLYACSFINREWGSTAGLIRDG